MRSDLSALTRLAATPLSAAMSPLATVPTFGAAGVGQMLEFQRRCLQLWLDSSQTIAMRFWLAPPWLVGRRGCATNGGG